MFSIITIAVAEMRYHFMSTRMAEIKEWKIVSVGEGIEELEPANIIYVIIKY